MKRSQFAIDLAPEEHALLDQIVLDPREISGPEAAALNGVRVAALWGHLTKRDAIPQHRLNWFVDPAFFVGGRGSSRQEVFERNGTRGTDILHHPHFLAHFCYFLHGPDLPDAVANAFMEKVRECGQVTSSDILPLAEYARKLARAHHLDRKAAAEEFFKLALECDLDAGHGVTVRSVVFRA